MTSHSAYGTKHFLHTLSIRKDKQMMSKVLQKQTTHTHAHINIPFYDSSSWLFINKYNHVCFPSQYRVYCVYFITQRIATEGHCFHPCLRVSACYWFCSTAHKYIAYTGWESRCPPDSALANLILNLLRRENNKAAICINMYGKGQGCSIKYKAFINLLRWRVPWVTKDSVIGCVIVNSKLKKV